MLQHATEAPAACHGLHANGLRPRFIMMLTIEILICVDLLFWLDQLRDDFIWLLLLFGGKQEAGENEQVVFVHHLLGPWLGRMVFIST